MRLSTAALVALAMLVECTPTGEREASGTPAPPPAQPSASSVAALASGPGVPSAAVPSPPPAIDAPPDAGLPPESGADAPPPDMLLVPAGTFTMGADTGGEADEHPAHRVTLPAFWLDRTHVTNADYDACVRASACHVNDRRVASRRHAGADAKFQGPRQPVVGVSWDDATAYCAWRGKRLPREAEFERAERGDDGRKFPWGNEPPTPDRAVFGRPLGAGSTDDVGTHPAGRGPYGHDDLAGDVWEWTQDEYDPYAYRRKTAGEGKPGTCPEILATLAKLRADGEQGFTGSNPIPTVCEHVLRGGAFNYDAHGLRATNRVHHPGRYRLVMAGFRCAKDAGGGRAASGDGGATSGSPSE